MSDEARQDDMVQQAFRNLFLGSAPERAKDLVYLFEELDPVFQLVPDIYRNERILMDAGAFRYVRYSHRVVRSFWIGAFAAWEAYRATANGGEIHMCDFTHFRALIASFEATLQNDQSDEIPIPTGIPEPGTLPDADKDSQGRAAAELAIIAVAWQCYTRSGTSNISAKEPVWT